MELGANFNFLVLLFLILLFPEKRIRNRKQKIRNEEA